MNRFLPTTALFGCFLIGCQPDIADSSYLSDTNANETRFEVEAKKVTVTKTRSSARVCDGPECFDKVISTEAGKGEITCAGYEEGDCPELPVFPLGRMAMTNSAMPGVDLAIGQSSNLARGVSRRDTSFFEASFTGAPADIRNVAVISDSYPSRFSTDSLLIELDNGDFYLANVGNQGGMYTFEGGSGGRR